MSKIRFGIIPAASSFLDVPIEEVAPECWHQLSAIGGEKIAEENVNEEIPVAYFILTGGTEQIVLNHFAKRRELFENEPVLLIAHPSRNSLPASMEILARLHQLGTKGKIIYLTESNDKESLNELEKNIRHISVFHQLKKIKIGLVGEPSDWLVASMPEIETIINVWGPSVVKISLNELKETIAEVKDEEVENEHFTFTKKSTETKEPTKKEVKQVVRVYGGLKKIIQKYDLNAVSVRCFDLVLDMQTTGCYALSKLNDDGVVAGCEGDLVSTLGMIWANAMTDQTVWMANPAQIDEQNNTILFAHCTVPTSMVQSYKLRSHYESGLGVGIEGEFTKGKVTLLRLGGKKLEKIWITSGEIVETSNSENLCRTQVTVKLHGSAKPSDLLNEPLGNHVLIMRGSFTKDMHNWWETFISLTK